MWGALSLWRDNGSVVYNCCWSSPAQSFSGPSPTELVTIFYCFRFETFFFVAYTIRRATKEVFDPASTRDWFSTQHLRVKVKVRVTWKCTLDERASVFIRDKLIFSSERMLHKDYHRKSSVEEIPGGGSQGTWSQGKLPYSLMSPRHGPRTENTAPLLLRGADHTENTFPLLLRYVTAHALACLLSHCLTMPHSIFSIYFSSRKPRRETDAFPVYVANEHREQRVVKESEEKTRLEITRTLLNSFLSDFVREYGSQFHF
jgi:hypothetical protein